MSYTCPTCRSSDDTAYVRCHHPMCPDGRDRNVPKQPPAPAEKPRKPFNWDRVWCFLVGVALVAQVWVIVGNHHLEDRLSDTREMLTRGQATCETATKAFRSFRNER